MALVGATCVDRYEASLVELHPGGAETPFSPFVAPRSQRVRAVSVPGAIPQGHVSMSAAWWACHASKKRLCRADEWVAACKGPKRTRYPYGDAREGFVCVDTGRALGLQSLYSPPAMYENANMNDPRLNQLPNTVARTGEASQCTNEYGVFDMVGNVNEWVDDSTMRGGFYLDTSLLGEGCEYATRSHSNVYFDYSTGFRCCAAPFDRDEDDDAAALPFEAMAALASVDLGAQASALVLPMHAVASR